MGWLARGVGGGIHHGSHGALKSTPFTADRRRNYSNVGQCDKSLDQKAYAESDEDANRRPMINIVFL